MRAVGKDLYPERIFVSRRLESLIPPAGAIQQRAAYRLGSAGIQIIYNGLDRLAHLRVRVFLLQAMLGDKSFVNRLTNGRAVILVTDTKVTGSRIKLAGLKIVIRQFYQ